MRRAPACQVTRQAMAQPALAHTARYFAEASRIAHEIDHDAIERLVEALRELRERGGRLFLLGVGGSAANCSHAVNDFRKLCGIEAYTPVDNVAELTARINDEGWETAFSAWLAGSHACERDAVFVLSVGGGDAERGISVNLVHALDEAKRRGLKIYGVVGRQGGYTKRVGDTVVVVPTVNDAHVTPHTEAFQAVVWHCVVSHPRLQLAATKWESAARTSAP
jgi:D-sedoheptulose 7-phosphate isomerase